MDADPVLNEIVEPYLHPPKPVSNYYGAAGGNTTILRQGIDFERGKRGALALGLMMNCATGCDPLSFNGYGCFCGFAGSGEPMDDIDM